MGREPPYQSGLEKYTPVTVPRPAVSPCGPPFCSFKGPHAQLNRCGYLIARVCYCFRSFNLACLICLAGNLLVQGLPFISYLSGDGGWAGVGSLAVGGMGLPRASTTNDLTSTYDTV